MDDLSQWKDVDDDDWLARDGQLVVQKVDGSGGEQVQQVLKTIQDEEFA